MIYYCTVRFLDWVRIDADTTEKTTTAKMKIAATNNNGFTSSMNVDINQRSFLMEQILLVQTILKRQRQRQRKMTVVVHCST